MPPSALPLQFQLHVKLLLTSRRTQLRPGHRHRIQSHCHKPQLRAVGPEPKESRVQQAVRTKRHTLLPSPHSELSSFHSFHPKFAVLGSGAGLGSLPCSPGRVTKIQVPQPGSDNASSHAEGQTCCPLSPSSKQSEAKTNATDYYSFTPSKGTRTGGHCKDPRATLPPKLVVSQDKSSQQHPSVALRSQTWVAEGPQLPNTLERPCSPWLLLCSSVHSRSQTAQPVVTPVWGDTRNSHSGEAVPPCPC